MFHLNIAIKKICETKSNPNINFIMMIDEMQFNYSFKNYSDKLQVSSEDYIFNYMKLIIMRLI